MGHRLSKDSALGEADGPFNSLGFRKAWQTNLTRRLISIPNLLPSDSPPATPASSESSPETKLSRGAIEHAVLGPFLWMGCVNEWCKQAAISATHMAFCLAILLCRALQISPGSFSFVIGSKSKAGALPSVRLFPSPLIDFLARILIEFPDYLSFKDAVGFFWSVSGEWPPVVDLGLVNQGLNIN